MPFHRARERWSNRCVTFYVHIVIDEASALSTTNYNVNLKRLEVHITEHENKKRVLRSKVRCGREQ